MFINYDTIFGHKFVLPYLNSETCSQVAVVQTDSEDKSDPLYTIYEEKTVTNLVLAQVKKLQDDATLRTDKMLLSQVLT